MTKSKRERANERQRRYVARNRAEQTARTTANQRRSRRLSGDNSWTWIMQELSNCTILCQNCHVAHHSGEYI